MFDAIGTRWQIDTADPLSSTLRVGIADLIDDFDRTWSRFRPDSLVADVARSSGTFDLGADAPAIFALYRRLHDVTDGAVSPFVGGRLDALGYDANYSFTQRGIPSPAPVWDEVALLVGTRLTTTRPVSIDIGAAGKGYLVDRVAELLHSAGHTAFTVDASGDLVHSGEPIRVALEHPFDPALAIGVLTLGGGALCASATNRRVWSNGLHHVIDGRTGQPTRSVSATWATAADAATADGAATALFFTTPSELSAALPIQGLRMFTDGSVEYSAGFAAELFR
ncbi:FAD:protein FMN transferase [Mycetocola zhadangensis]|uniref:FAD:protein FMN transferase n=2 Tax=Mycetocola zhadangensis TaxID=1164595 RepID=A0A3L7ITP1_9MICO|nr:FAD:protein FMN transferase [Mycetocola zhadangensis]